MALAKFSRSIEGSVAIITGAASGMGQATARVFADAGARLALIDINEEPLVQEAAHIAGAGVDVRAYPLDLSDGAAIQATIGRVAADFGGIDILVNNAGIAKPGDFLDTSVEQFTDVINVNLIGTFVALQRAAKNMIKHKIHGSIVNMSSINAVVAIPTIAAYSASKGGVMQLTKACSLALVEHGIRVNAVGPGSIDTEMMAGVNANPDAMKTVMSRTPMKRIGTPREIGDVVAFLTSDKASYITGETIYVDGGRLGMNYTC